MDRQQQHARLEFHPGIVITAEHASKILGIPLQKADELLSAPETYGILQSLLGARLHLMIDEVLKGMARHRWPQETLSGVRRDCTVELPSLPLMHGTFQGK